MAYMKPLNFLVVLLLLSFVNSDFAPWIDWTLTAFHISYHNHDFLGRNNGENSPHLSRSDGIYVNLQTNCNFYSKNGGSWTLDGDYSGLIASQTHFVVGFWVNFQTTANSPKVFQFGSSSGAHYLVSSPTDGSLKVSFYSGSTTTDSNNDFSITVPLNKWFFLAFEFVDNSETVTINVYQSTVALISKNSVAGSTAPFTLPNGKLSFGQSITGKFYEVVVATSAEINASGIALKDSSNNSKQISNTCTSGDCNDPACDSDGKCLTWKEYCTGCAIDYCEDCDLNSGRKHQDYCQTCDSGNTWINGHCCANANNCAGCSTKSTVCDSCPTGYFLYDDTASTTICNPCPDSFTICNPGTVCYNCANAIVHDGDSCDAQSIGVEISIENTNIVFDFAHPLSTGLSESSFTAISNASTPISTDGWTFSGCIANSKKCIIGAPNIKESDLPMALDYEFNQV